MSELKTEVKKEKLWSLAFIIILFINAINGTATYMVNPNFADYLVSKGAAFEFTGLISSLLSWIALLLRPFSGAISDRANKKVVMLISYVVTAICMMLYSMTDSLTVLTIVRIIHGMAFGVSGTISMAYATSYIPMERMGEGIGYVGIATLSSSFIGPQLGDFVVETFGSHAVFFAAGLLMVVDVLLIFSIKGQKQEAKAKEVVKKKISFDDFFAKELIFYVLFIGMFSFGNGIISYYLKTMGNARGIPNITLFFTAYSLVLFASKPISGKLLDAKGADVILYPSYIIAAIGMFVLGGAYSLLPVLIAAVLKAIGQGSGAPAIQSQAIKMFGKERSGVAISTLFIGQDLGNAIGPVVASGLIVSKGYTFVFWGYAVLLLITDVIYFLYRRYQQAKEKQ